MDYVGLHAHSTFSFMDGFGLPKEHAERVAELGGSALAQTDHANVTGHVQHEIGCDKAGIKPIFGCEVYTAPADMREQKNMRKWHMILLAQNEIGYRNLMQVVSRSWSEGFYRWPTVLGSSLTEHHSGLVCLSGCADSHLNCVLLGGKGIPEPEDGRPRYAAARQVALGYKALFGDRYYLEVQRFPGLERCRAINPIMEKLSADIDVPLVATADVHYPRPADNEIQKILHAAGRNTGTVAAAEASWEYDILLTHPTSDTEIYKDLLGTGLSKRAARAAIGTTAEIAERCSVTLPKADWLVFPGTRKDVLWS